MESELKLVTVIDHKRTTKREAGIINVGTGIKDTKGREIGGWLRLEDWDVVTEEIEIRVWKGLSLHEEDEPGPLYLASPHATRDGIPFGASQGTRSFKTRAERDKYIEKYRAGVQRRAENHKKRAQ